MRIFLYGALSVQSLHVYYIESSLCLSKRVEQLVGVHLYFQCLLDIYVQIIPGKKNAIHVDGLFK